MYLLLHYATDILAKSRIFFSSLENGLQARSRIQPHSSWRYAALCPLTPKDNASATTICFDILYAQPMALTNPHLGNLSLQSQKRSHPVKIIVYIFNFYNNRIFLLNKNI